MGLQGLLADRADRRTVREHVAAAADAAVRPPAGERYELAGPDPVRLLLLGGGVAVGHGAATRHDALDGRLGERIAAATGRGVVVENLGAHDSRLADQIRLADAARTDREPDLLIWCPSYVEMTDRVPAARWGRLLRALLRRTPAAAVVVLELPVPTGSDAAAVAAAPIIDGINRRLRRAAAGVRGITVVAPPPVPVRPKGQALFDRDYYDVLAQLVLAAAPEVAPARTTATAG